MISNDVLNRIRQAERESHLEVYSAKELYEAGSWLAKPVKTVLDILPLFDGYEKFCALDLGSGVGRNSIPVAQYFKDISCRVDCVDILEYAVERLRGNAKRFGVESGIHGVVSSIDEYEIEIDRYDLILAVSALEHVDSEHTFLEKLQQIRDGLRIGGVTCLIVNSGVVERDSVTGEELQPQFEVNLPTDKLVDILNRTFYGYTVVKQTTAHQRFTIPRGERTADLETDVVTLVVRKDPQALFELAMNHIYGNGVPEDNELAVKLLTHAYDMGHVEAAYNSRICYHYGHGTQVDLEKAYALYLESANAGYGKGMELVGRFYNRGIYVDRDPEKAELWLRKAMESSDSDAVEEARKELLRNS